MHQERQTTTLTETEATRLETAIAQAVTQSQQTAAAAATAAALAQQQAEQRAIARFQLPFDDHTLNALPELAFRFEGEERNLQTIGYFTYQDLVVELTERGESMHSDTWFWEASRQGVQLLTRCVHVYPNSSWGGYNTVEQIGRDFLVFLHEAVNTPNPAPAARETGTYEDFRARRKQRERFIREAMHGALIGLTSTGIETGACLQTALFAIETAEQVLRLLDATPLQRKVLGLLNLEQFTEWLGSKPSGEIVGSLAAADHPVCRYLKAKGVELNFSNLVLYGEDGGVSSATTARAPCLMRCR